MKKILCINYSQSGQLDEILDNFTAPIDGVKLERIKVLPKNPFAFPWQTNNFYGGMPETVLEEAIEIEPIKFKEEKYDLIILGYQPWFLSPSMPTTALLKNHYFLQRVKNTPVITVIGARNMWLNAQSSVVSHIGAAGGKMVGNIALVDRAPNHLSAVSIAHWMMTGKKTRKWGIFPIPGISVKDIEGCSTFGTLVQNALVNDDFIKLQSQIIHNGGLRVNTNILFIESKAKKIFFLWANLIKKKEAKGKSRKFWIGFFRIYLNTALFGVAPILLAIDTVFIRIFTRKSIAQKKKHYSYLGMKPSE